MPKLIFNGEPGTTFENDTGKVLFQLIVNWTNSCGLCIGHDHEISTGWPLPYHRGCKCVQRLLAPGHTSEPFVNFFEKVQELEPHQQSRVIGRSNLILVERGIVGWDDVVTSTRVRDFREVVSRLGLKVDQMVRAGVNPRLAQEAYAAVHTPAHELAAQQRQDLLSRLASKGLERDQVKRALAERLAARVGIGAGPSGSQGALVVPGTPRPPGPTPVPKPAPQPKPAPVRKIATPKPQPVPIPAPISGGAPTVQQQHLKSVGVNQAGLDAVHLAEMARRANLELAKVRAEFAVAKAAKEQAEAAWAAVKARPGADPAEIQAARERARATLAKASQLARQGERLKAWHEDVKTNPDLIPPLPIAERLEIYAQRTGAAKVKAILDLKVKAPDHSAELTALEKAREDARARRLATKNHQERERLETELLAINTKIRQLRNTEAPRPSLDVLAKAIGPAEPLNLSATFDKVSHMGLSRVDPLTPSMIPAIETGMDWLRKLTAAGGINRMDVPFARLPDRSAARSHCNSEGVVLEEGSLAGAPRVVIHEVGHYLEFHTGAGQAALDFLRYRVGDEKPQRMMDLFPGVGYDPAELGRKDRFDEALQGTKPWYAGKDYGGTATEITSIGLETLYLDPVRLAKHDPEYCMFILGILDGSLR